MNLNFTTGFLILVLFATSLSFAQEDRVVIDPSQIPNEASGISGFVPKGWKIEEQITGDLNNDSLPDYVLKLVEDKPEKQDDSDFPAERQRALIIVFGTKEGKLSRAAVAERLLQCTTCGGAFYGVGEAPADIKIKKGVLVVNQDRGSRELNDETYRFRYESDTGKFALIGFDFACRDRLTGNEVFESTNYLTGMRIVTRKKEDTSKTYQQSVPKEKVYIEQVDSDEFDAAAVKRLHL
jgi:hypothetical protein